MRRRAIAVLSLVLLAPCAGMAGCRPLVLPAAVRGVTVPRAPAPKAGTGTVLGVVADSGSGYPVVGASLFFTRDSVIGTGPARPRDDLPRARTDRGGGFVLPDLPPGEYTLAFDDLDHFPIRRVVVVRADQVHAVTLRPRRRGTP